MTTTQTLAEILPTVSGNEAIVAAFHHLASNMSYFNAAEGECRHKEANARSSTRASLMEVEAEIKSRGIQVDRGRYLL
ncbi:hypothetical protein [Cupriavidus basilensis]|uniref:hypothetical protein n=1 Tax=Cupriavidus basilensis TaxID=68895 RepID=UPI0005BA1B1B|nr:hypothetical protein [Cupriavidus basilensis]